MDLYNKTTFEISKLVTQRYSSSFSMASSMFEKDVRDAIYSVYGFVRFADEIVDTFHEHDKLYLIQKFEDDYYDAYKQGISLNPILNAFQITVKKYNIPDVHVQAFLNSMKFDLSKTVYKNVDEMNEYIYGSADVVGLMCLKVFCNGSEKMYDSLEEPARRLGSAFQKVNFLRDLKNDLENLNRKYFPNVDHKSFDEEFKQSIVDDIKSDFDSAYQGIQKLPKQVKLPVLVAYNYYNSLLHKIEVTPAKEILKTRIRVSDSKKIVILGRTFIGCKLNFT